jgi:hypothetical protein
METDDIVPTKAEMLERLAAAAQQPMIPAPGGEVPQPEGGSAGGDYMVAPNGQTLPIQPPSEV